MKVIYHKWAYKRCTQSIEKTIFTPLNVKIETSAVQWSGYHDIVKWVLVNYIVASKCLRCKVVPLCLTYWRLTLLSILLNMLFQRKTDFMINKRCDIFWLTDWLYIQFNLSSSVFDIPHSCVCMSIHPSSLNRILTARFKKNLKTNRNRISYLLTLSYVYDLS